MNASMKRRLLIAVSAGSLLALGWLPAASRAVTVTSGVSFTQIDYNWDAEVDTNSNTGEILADQSALQTASGLSSGYLNVVTSDGWVVQNLPVLNGNTSTYLQLPTVNGVDETSVNATVDYSASPLTAAPGVSASNFGVGAAPYKSEGDSGVPSGGTPVAPTPNAITFNPGGQTTFVFQTNHQNVQAADNQCVPAAIANNLQWLKDTYGMQLAQYNIKGLGANSPSRSLVGKLDVTTLRAFNSRTDGSPVARDDNVRGILQYLSNDGNTTVKVKHMGFAPGIANIGSTDLVAGGMTSKGQGNQLTFQFILDELTLGNSVQLSYSWPAARGGGGHSVEVVGAGKILGVPIIWYKSDHEQTDAVKDPNDTVGAGFLDWSFLDANLNLVNEANVPQAQFAASETVPEPSTWVLLALGGISLALLSRRPRRTKSVV